MTLPGNLLVKYSPIGECLLQPLQLADIWLGADEVRELERLRDERRRQQWLAGRWLSKLLIRQAIDVTDFASLQILTRDERHRGVRPQLVLAGRVLPWSLSISHSERGVVAALACTDEFSVGVDLAGEVPTTESFARLWFSGGERRWLTANPERRMSDLWALKEAIYKAVNTGESWDPRDIELSPQRQGGFHCCYRGRMLQPMALELQQIDQQFAAVVCLPRAAIRRTPSRLAGTGPAQRSLATESTETRQSTNPRLNPFRNAS